MFRLPTWLSSVGVLVIGILWVSYLCYFKEESLSEAKRTHLKEALAHSVIATATQTRTQVYKDIWITEPNLQRLQNKIHSQRSVLILQPKEHSLEIVEKLYDIQCWNQEKRLGSPKEPMYQMRFLQAKEGQYKFQTQTFEATDANLALYKIPGFSLITSLALHKAFLKGTAKEISFTIKEGVPCFQAHEFRASLSSGANRDL